jgi:hypothetical protein
VRTLLLIVIRLVVSVMLTACVLGAIVVTVPLVEGDWRLGAGAAVLLTAGFFAFLSWVWPAQRR